MKFIGLENYKGLNPYTFPNRPYFTISKGPKCKFDNNFQYAIFHFNMSQILQWIYYLYEKNNRKIPKSIIIVDKVQNLAHKTFVTQTFGNTNLKIFSKTTTFDKEFLSYLNEYFIGVYGTNYLRINIPNFGFYYNLEHKKDKITVSQEYVPYEGFKNFLYQKYDKIYHSKVGTQFLSIFLQIISSLEYAQNTLQFTHYDLHNENILLRRNNTKYTFSIPIFDSVYEFEKPEFIATIIDFGFSSIRFQKDKIISNWYGFPKYGYYPFFNSSIDMSRILFTTYDISKNFYNKEKKPFHWKIIRFCEFIFQYFYEINMKELKDKQDIFRTNFYNFTGFPQTYKTPFELLQFILANKKFICNIFEIDKLPIQIKKKDLVEPILNYYDSTCVADLLCVTKIDKTIYHNPLNNFYGNKHKLNLNLFRKKISDTNILKNPLPRLKYSNIMELTHTYLSYQWFKEGYEKLYNDNYVRKTRNDVFFKRNIRRFSKVYKNLTTIEQFCQYRHMSKKSLRQSSAIDNYENKIHHIFMKF